MGVNLYFYFNQHDEHSKLYNRNRIRLNHHIRYQDKLVKRANKFTGQINGHYDKIEDKTKDQQRLQKTESKITKLHKQIEKLGDVQFGLHTILGEKQLILEARLSNGVFERIVDHIRHHHGHKLDDGVSWKDCTNKTINSIILEMTGLFSTTNPQLTYIQRTTTPYLVEII